MNYDNLADTLDKKMFDFNLKMLGVLGPLLIKPLAMCTEPLFRKNFGERYFTAGIYTVSIVLWCVAQKFAGFNPTGEPTMAQKWLGDSAVSISPENIGRVFLVAYVILGMWNLSRARRRRGRGQVWYSMGRGESLFGRQDKTRDLLFAGLVIVFLALTAPALALLFFASQAASQYLAGKQQASFYNRYLDAMDAKIESEFLQQALDKGEPPSDTDGLHCPLPKVFKGEHRTRVARVVAGGAFDPDAPQATPENPPAPRPPAARPDFQPAPARSVPSVDPSPTANVKAMARADHFAFLKSKRFVRAAVIFLVAGACVYGAVALIRVIPFHRTPPVVASVAVAQPVPPTPMPAPPPVARTDVQPQPPESPPAVAPTAEVKTQAPPTLPVEVAPPAVAPVDSAAIAQTALEKQRQEEQARLAQERQNAVEQITNMVSVEIAMAGKFKVDCETAFAANSNKLSELSFSSRKKLGQQNSNLQDTATDLITHEQAALDKLAHSLPLAITNSAWNPQPALTKMQAAFSKMEQDRQTISADLQTLVAAISNAPAKKPLLKFN
jgi:hypothetical protein